MFASERGVLFPCAGNTCSGYITRAMPLLVGRASPDVLAVTVTAGDWLGGDHACSMSQPHARLPERGLPHRCTGLAGTRR